MDSIINKSNPNPFGGSYYYDKINVDFESLPNTIINEGILRFFEPRILPMYPELHLWKSDWLSYLNGIPQKHKLTVIKKGLEFGQMAYNYHIENECKFPKLCNIHERWQMILEYAEEVFNENTPKENFTTNHSDFQTNDDTVSKKEFTTARQVLAIHYLLEHCRIPSVDNTAKARFIQFLTGRESGASNIKNTTIYKKVSKPFSIDNKTLNADLDFIRKHFEDLGLSEIALKITKEISKTD
jgi:hypothetical protein